LGDFVALFGILFAIALAVVAFVLPIVALLISRRSSQRVEEMTTRLETLQRELAHLWRQTQTADRAAEPSTLVSAPARAVAETASASEIRPAKTAPPSPAPLGRASKIDLPPTAEKTGTFQATSEISPRDVRIGHTELLTAATPVPSDAGDVAAAAAPPETSRGSGASSGPPSVPGGSGFALPSAPSGSSSTLEEKIALVWFTRIGAIALLFGVAYFYKYAVDNQWVGPLGRIVLGTIVGLALLGFAEYTKTRTKAIYVQVVIGVGLALMYVSAYASYGFYHLFPIPAAFAAVAVITLLGGALAIYHKAEAILILSFVAGFLSPILLSTGEDRPGALFTYLFILTALGFATALQMGFRYALWLGVAGVVFLFAGWYERFFDIHPVPKHPMVDVPLDKLEGAYLPLAKRIVPLASVLAFLAEWLLVYAGAKRKREVFFPLAFLVSALVLGHVGFALLLHDHAVLLGVVLTALALASTALLGREGRRELLSIPLAASFVVLMATVRGAEQHAALAMVAVMALWGLIYAVGFLRGQAATAGSPRRLSLILTGSVGVVFAIAAAVLLLDAHYLEFGLVLVVLSIAYGGLSIALGVFPIAAIAAAISFFGLLVANPWQTGSDHGFILVAAAWAAVYLAAGVYELFGRRQTATAERLITISGAGLGFVLLAQSQTGPGEWLLRAVILGVPGLIDAGIGWRLMRRGEHKPASVMLGQALALFAAAVACIFSGATITVVWAAMAAVVAVLASQSEDQFWLAGACGLFAAVLVRLIGWDIEQPYHLQRQFFATLGAQGELLPKFLLNPRSYALAGSAAAFFVAARSTSRKSNPLFRNCAVGYTTFGHVALLALILFEVHRLILQTPVPPASVSTPEFAADFAAFRAAFLATISSQQDRLVMSTTIVFASYASLLIAIGFGARERLHRYLGLGLFSIALLKLVLWDVWSLPRIYKTMVLIGTGALLLGASYMYARFGRRLVALLRDGTTEKAVTILIFVAAALGSLPARAFDTSKLAEMRLIGEVNTPGYYRIEIEPEIYRHSRAQGPLEDLRVVGPAESEVPYIIRDVPIQKPETVFPGTIVDPVTLADGSARAVIDLGRSGLKHNQMRLTIEGEDFLRQARIEVSDDEAHFAVLSEGQRLYRITRPDNLIERTTLTYPVSDSRYLRVSILSGSDDKPLRIARAAAVHFEETASRALMGAIAASIERLPPEPDAHATEFIVDLRSPGVPIRGLVLDVATQVFERPAHVSASTNRTYWAPAGGGVIYRADGAASRPAPQNLRLEIGGSRKRYLRLTVHDGSNPPLDIKSAVAEYRVQELVFRVETAGTYAVYLGAELSAPSYDLASVLSRAGEVPIQTAELGAWAENPRFGQPPRAQGALPFTERYKIPASVGLAILLAALAAWTFRLLKRAKID